MYVDSMSVCLLEARQSQFTDSPDWPDIESAIRNLDGQQTCLVTLGGDCGHLTISGGEGSYVVSADVPGCGVRQAAGPQVPGEVRLRLAGKLRSIPARLLLDLGSAILAAKAFALAGCLSRQLEWLPT